MTQTYYAPKDEVKNVQLRCMTIFFNNGESIQFDKSEICIKDMVFADKLALSPKDCRPSPLVYKGEILITPKNKVYPWTYNVLNDKKLFTKNRKDYIFNLINNVGVFSVKIHSIEYGGFVYVGKLDASTKDDYIKLVWSKPYPNCTCDSDNMEFDFDNIKKSNIITISLANQYMLIGEANILFFVQHEIVDMQLNFQKKLSSWHTHFFERKLDSGYLIIKPDKSRNLKQNNTNHEINIHEVHHLYITYGDYYGNYDCYDHLSGEGIQISDMDDGSPLVKEYYTDAAAAGQYVFVGGYSKKLKDGTILITFGKNARQTLEKLIQNKQKSILL